MHKNENLTTYLCGRHAQRWQSKHKVKRKKAVKKLTSEAAWLSPQESAQQSVATIPITGPRLCKPHPASNEAENSHIGERKREKLWFERNERVRLLPDARARMRRSECRRTLSLADNNKQQRENPKPNTISHALEHSHSKNR